MRDEGLPQAAGSARRDADSPGHPVLAGALLMIGVVVFLVLISVAAVL